MYSLYRAWLSLGPCPIPSLPPPPLNLTTTTSTVTGAPDVSLQVGPGLTHFSAHRAVLGAHSGFFKAALANHTEPTPIVVPNVNIDEFSSLLTFMYTGYLDLNLSNIYNILLATHILHMPRALEICRSFLLHSQPPPPTTTIEPPPTLRPTIIKPIASRKTAPITQQIFPPTYSANLQKSNDTPFKTVNNTTNPPPAPSPQQASTSKKPPIEPQPKIKHKKRNETTTNNDKVIIDIACCDGPVRFHRVINKHYGQLDHSENIYESQDNVNRSNTSSALNKAMNENIRDQQQQMSDENQQSNNEMFTCLYCNHTFKSQYCYQKHARRHLNPVSLDPKTTSSSSSTATMLDSNHTKERQLLANPKREVKLLDMNVQYYPCKTCGSKFPSYYFVHKHRKLCHADEMADNNNKNNEMLPQNHQHHSDSGSSDAIDVEATNDN